MIHLLWPSLIFPVISIGFSAGSSVVGQPDCSNGFCISVSDKEITAESGLCVVITCSFQTPSSFKPQHLIWFRCESDKICGDSDIIFHTNKNNKKNIKSEFLGRLSLLDPDLNHQNCSIIISDLRESDSGFYQLRVIRKINGKLDGFTFGKRTQVNVGGSRQKPTVTLPDLTVGHQATLTCTAPALCSKSPPGITWMWRGAAENDPLTNGSITAFKKESLTAVTQRHYSTLTFIPTTEHHNSKITCRIQFSDDTTTEETVNLHVNYTRKPQISGKVIVKEGEVLNLTCSVDSFPPAVWTGLWSNLHNGSDHNGSATLIVTNVTAEDSGRYFCAANHQNWIETVHVDVTVMLEGSACVRRSDVLTCTWIGTGFPLPNIKWPQLSPPTEYWLTTNVSGHTVRSSLTLKATKQDNVSAECVINNESGESTETLTIQDILFEKEGDQSRSILEKIGKIETIKIFLIGVLTSTIFCILIPSCYREKRKRFENLQEMVEMVGSQDNPLIHDGLTVAEDPNCLPEGAENEAVSTGEAAPKPRSEEDDKTLLRSVSKEKDTEEEAVYSSVNDLTDEI